MTKMLSTLTAQEMGDIARELRRRHNLMKNFNVRYSFIQNGYAVVPAIDEAEARAIFNKGPWYDFEGEEDKLVIEIKSISEAL